MNSGTPISVSFIIPYYNLGRTLLERAVRSVIAAAGETDWEIIVVDDGTPDSPAAQWLDEFHDGRIRYVYRKNGGLSEARNTGMQAARKSYLQFVDADDYLFAPAYRECLRILDRERPDVLIFRHKKVYSELIEKGHVGSSPCRIFENGIRYLKSVNLHGSAWSYLFRKETANGLSFVPGIYHEDEEFTPRLIFKAGKTVETGTAAYAYFQRRGSIINSHDPASTAKRFADMLTILQGMENWRDSLSGEGREAVTRRLEQLSLAAIYKILQDAPDRKTVGNELRKLRSIGCYPLPKRRYSRRYALFCRLTDKPWKLAVMRTLLKKR